LSAEELAAYIDGTLDKIERERVESVLASSPAARAELIEASRLVVTMPTKARSARRPWIVASVASAAAAVLLAIAPTLSRKQEIIPVWTERRVPVDDAAKISVIAPEEGAIVDASATRFSWHSVTGATYQLTVTDADGRAVWQNTTADTTLSLPPDVKLDASETYYWNVDALAADGSSTTTGVRSFKPAVK
jgi:hypothetical protein